MPRRSRYRLAVLAVSLPLCLLAIGTSASAAQSDPKTAMLERAGWDALAANQPRAAAEAFRQALADDPKNALLHLGAGLAAYIERRDADAQAALGRAVQLNPKLTRARELLGLVLYRAGDLLGAMRAVRNHWIPATPGTRTQ